MATTGLITVQGKDIQEVNAIPSASAGTYADDLGSIALFNNSGVGQAYLKTSAADTAWDRFVTANDGTFIAPGTFLNIPLFDTSPGPAAHLAGTALQNAQTVQLNVANSATRSAGITFTVPNPGDAITAANFVLTQGVQTIVGATTFSALATFNGGITVNGSVTTVNSTTTNVTDPYITLNVGGAAGSAAGAGIKIQENSLITGSLLTSSDRNGYTFLAPNNANAFTMTLASLTAAQTISVPNTSGTFVTRATASPGTLGQLAFYADANNLLSSANLFWNNANSWLGIGNNAPTVALHVTGAARITSLTANQPVRSDTSGNLSNSLISLTSDVTGVLPVTSGGTGAATAFTLGSVVFAGTSGIYSQNNANFFWDNTNGYLGLGTALPARTLDVNGTSVFRGAMRQDLGAAAKPNWERLQAYVATTTSTVTTLATVATITDSVTMIKATVMARRTGGTAGSVDDSATFVRTARVKNVAGTVSIATLQTDFTTCDQKGVWAATISFSGTSALITVAGAANNNIDWTVTYDVVTLS